jgi:hypothetical protein
MRAGLTALLALPGLALTAAVSGPASATATSRASTWHVEYRQQGTEITAVSATGPGSAWAMGIDRSNGKGLLLHWNGSRWRPRHYPGETAHLATAIFALSATDLWIWEAVRHDKAVLAVAILQHRRFLLAAVPHARVAWMFGSYCRLPGACRTKGLIAELR